MSNDQGTFVGGEGEAGPSRQPYVHPSRLISGVHTAPEPKQKTKSDNQKRYEKKKNKKRKKVLKAQKAAAPKHKVQTSWKVDPVLEALKRAAVASNGDNRKDGNEGVVTPKSVTEVEKKDITVPVVESSTSNTKTKKTKKQKKEEDKAAAAVEVDSEGDREKRRAEKREKREKRDRKERRQQEREALLKAEAKAEEEAAKAVEFASRAADGAMDVDGGHEDTATSESDEDEDEAEEEEEEGDEKMNEDAVIEELPDPSRAKSPSPPPLQAFPLPTSAPAPSAAILARQGLPAGLEDATFIDQDLRVGLDDLQVRHVIGREPLSERIKGVLRGMGVDDFFAVQAAILPHLLPLRQVPLPYDTLHDYLISAPTGSGKTLAYAVPIVEILSKRIITRLRALIVLPTRDLVGQVRETLEVLARGTGLTVGAITGQHSFAQEQTQLVGDLETKLLGGSSKLDILVATPGRLMDHLNSTPNFTLQHLRFLVIDEADRLLNQSFQDWLAQVLSYTRPPAPAPRSEEIQLVAEDHSHSSTIKVDGEVEDDVETPSNDPVAPAWMEALGLRKRDPEWMFRPRNVCQKLLFSATLTRDPSKVAALSLTDPQYFIVQSSSLANEPINLGEQFAFPSTLQEKMLILPPALKPLNLIHLVHEKEYGVDKALVFTKSTESAMRLVKLFEFFEDAYILGGGGGKRVVVKLYTGDIKASERKKVLAEFAEGKINLLICSDLIARGMDLPTVSHVVSYDIPLDMRKYVHRVGRTARAGRQGTAWTLVEKQEALHFKGMMRDADHLKAVKKVKVQEESLAGYRESYDIAIRRLKEHFGRDA